MRRWRVLALVAPVALVAALLAPRPAIGQSSGTAPAGAVDGVAATRASLAAPPADLDRSTPARSWRAFVAAAGARDFERAAWLLDLDDVSADQSRLVGPSRAAKLWRVLRTARAPEVRDLPDEVDPTPLAGGGSGRWLVMRFQHPPSSTEVAVTLERAVTGDAGAPAWRVSSDTVSSIAHWYARIVDGNLQAVTAAELDRGLGPRPPGLDLSTPARSLRSFLDATRSGRLDVAARSLWLDDIPAPQQAEVGRRLARQLAMVLDQTLWIDFATVSDRSFGKPESSDIPDDEDEIGTVPTAAGRVPIRMVRVPDGVSSAVWVMSRTTVSRIPTLYGEYGIGPLVEWIPGVLFSHRFLEIAAWQWLGLGAALVVAVAIGALAQRLLLGLVGMVAARFKTLRTASVSAMVRGPLRALLAVAALSSLITLLRLSKPALVTVDSVLVPLTVALVTWLVIRLGGLVTLSIEHYLAAASTDIGLQRSVSTRLQLVRRLFNLLVVLVGSAAVLMRFEVVRHVGTALLASAGVAGIVLGFAAQQTLSNLFSGLLFGITQPVRIGDIVVFEGQWGFVEEISLTHVVICTWDLRRLVVPIPYLLARPIENWTRSSSEILGTVELSVDHQVDMDALRAAAVEAAKASAHWDGKDPSVVVTNLTVGAVEVRIVVGAANTAALWDLRCEVRERMLRWLQRRRAAAPHG